MDADKKIQQLGERLRYIQDVFASKQNDNVKLLETKFAELKGKERGFSTAEKTRQTAALEDLFGFVEQKLDRELTPMDKVRIVRHPQRICLKDILENVYDNYTEIGGRDEYSIDPSMLIARAYITRKKGGKVVNQPVMVIGQEKGHGQEFRNGGSVKPWGNAKALQYMKVAETENIPIHTYVFTPGAFPVEDWPGAAQQIARNLYEMAGLKTPVISVFSEGGSGGAEAVGLGDFRLMLSHGYYSVISPEGGAAIEAGIRQGQRVSPELIESTAANLKMTAEDNLAFGYIDRVVAEPNLGARPEHFDFFKTLRREVIRATDQVVLSARGHKGFLRILALKGLLTGDAETDAEDIFVRWSLTPGAKERLLARRWKKFAGMSRGRAVEITSLPKEASKQVADLAWGVYSFLKYDLFKKYHEKLSRNVEDARAEAGVVLKAVLSPVKKALALIEPPSAAGSDMEERLTALSSWSDQSVNQAADWKYLSPRAREDRAVSCPNAHVDGCLDLWAPDLFGEFAGVCQYCGHHFPMEYLWYLYNIFDPHSIVEFNADIEAGNPLDYPGLDVKLDKAKKQTGQKSSCITFEGKIEGVKVVVAMLTAGFRGGSVGAAEGEKFFRAAERARKKRFPFIAYVHGTAGIRIQEGVNGVIQMPRCTMAVRRYIEAGGLYVVLYDTNSYAGPVASFLGCSPYQFAVRSANIGFAGPGVIKETTGVDIPPDYHKAYRALARSHIQGIWDRREIRKNLFQSLMTVGGRNLYYR